jgi:membrane protein DedA with SNARE-associated domain
MPPNHLDYSKRKKNSVLASESLVPESKGTALKTILQSLIAHPYTVVLFAAVVERIGLPVFLSPVLIGAGALAATGRMQFDVAVWIALVACIAGDSLWYELGRKRGDSVLSLLCRISLEPESCVRRTRNFFSKGTTRTVLISKWLPGLSHIVPAVAGLSSVDRMKFFLSNTAGSAIWIVALMLAGYVPVARWHLGPAIGPFVFEAGLVLLAGNVGFKYIQKQRFLRELDQARIAPKDLAQMIEKGESLVILDLRHPLDSVTDPRTLPGALRVLPDEVTARAQLLPKDQDIILYCT